jgi:threonine dehydrogenase-like Zn-dependent dehydrogenase
MKELDIRGSRNAMPEDFEAVIAHLENVAFPVDEVISKTVSLHDAPVALAAWSENPGEITKIHVTLD